MAKKYAENIHNNKIQIDIGIELSTDAWHLLITNLPATANIDFMQPWKNSIEWYKKHIEQSKYTDIYPWISIQWAIKYFREMYPNCKIHLPHPFDGNIRSHNALRQKGVTNYWGVAKNIFDQDLLEDVYQNVDFVEIYNYWSLLRENIVWFLGERPWSAWKWLLERTDVEYSWWTDSHIGEFTILNIIKKWDNSDIYKEREKGNHLIVKSKKTEKWIVSLNDLKFFFSWVLDYYVNEHKIDWVPLSWHTKRDDIKDTVWKHLRRSLYWSIYKHKIKEILTNKGYSEDEMNRIIKKMKGNGKRFSTDFLSPHH
jgi:hypothetical protein